MNINDDIYSRTYGIYGPSMEILFSSHVAVVGLGGVGGALALSLARAGVGELTLIDGDYVAESNLNRQAISSRSNLGRNKAEVCAELIKDINPEIKINLVNRFIKPDTIAEEFGALQNISYVADAIDDVESKLDLIEYCNSNNIRIISSMGAGNKVNPCGFVVKDISKTKVDPLARVIRQRLRKRGIYKLKCVYSEENPRDAFSRGENTNEKNTAYVKRRPPSSSPFVPSAAGLLMGSEIVKDIIGEGEENLT